MLDNLINKLNDKQKEAIYTENKPLLILAGAGTGKTSVVTSKIAYRIMNGLNTANVLCLTFTNKAANEMKARIKSNIGDVADNMWIGTFHSICIRILRYHFDKVGLQQGFTIIDTDDQTRIVKDLLDEHNIDKKCFPAKSVVFQISDIKERAIIGEYDTSKYATECDGKFRIIFNKYNDAIKKLNMVDFNDIINFTNILLTKHTEVLQIFQNKFTDIYVDEFQDTNASQYYFLKKISQSTKNINFVGDDDQSIYGWRGADIKNILSFENDFPGGIIVKLEQNYRSTINILNAANDVIKNNNSRLGKTLYSNGSTGDKVNVICHRNGLEEANYISKTIQEEKKYKDNAILVRSGFQTRIIEESLIKSKIPYKIVGALKFYEREEIKDAIAYLRLINASYDDLALRRIINKPPRSIGNVSVNKIILHSIDTNKNLFDVCCDDEFVKTLSAKTKNSVIEFVNIIIDFKKDLGVISVSNLMENVLQKIGYQEYIKTSKKNEAKSKIENLAEFVNLLNDYDDINTFLEHVSLVYEADEKTDSDHNYVSVITIHSAKGLEFNNVFLCGWEEGNFPSSRSIDTSGIEGLEEERRLAYVGITRAKSKCYINYAESRLLNGEFISTSRSRFIDEIKKENYELIINNNSYNNFNYNKKSMYESNIKPSSFSLDTTGGWNISDRCFHVKFGVGTVKMVNGEFLDVMFDGHGFKKIMNKFLDKM